MKHRVSPSYIGIYMLCIMFSIACVVGHRYLMFPEYPNIRAILKDGWGVIYWSFTCVYSVPGVLSVYEIIKGFVGARYSVDDDGITTYLGKRHWHLHWSEVVEYDIVRVKISIVSNVEFIYCTTVPLTSKEKNNFLWYRRKHFDTTMYFQVCNKGAVAEFLSYIPDADRVYLSYLLNQDFGW